MKKNGAIAVVMNSKGAAISVPGMSSNGSVNEDMVRHWIDQDLERYPEHRAKAAAIKEIVILSSENISPIHDTKDITNCYLTQIEANNWATPDGLHIFEAFLGPVTVYIAYGT